MEELKMNTFEELSQNEMMDVDGGFSAIDGLVIGLAILNFFDVIIIATTGKSIKEWFAKGIELGIRKIAH